MVDGSACGRTRYQVMFDVLYVNNLLRYGWPILRAGTVMLATTAARFRLSFLCRSHPKRLSPCFPALGKAFRHDRVHTQEDAS
jgi:hypothetical protein